MAEHLLHGPEVRAAFQQVRGEAVPERVRCDPLLDPGPLGAPLDHAPRTDARERLPTGVEENAPFGAAMVQRGTQHAKVHRNRTDRPAPDGYEPFLAALAEHPHEALLQQEGPEGEPAELGNAEPRAIPQLEQGAIAPRQRLLDGGSAKDGFDLTYR